MSVIERKLIICGLRAILTPVARYCIRHALKFQDLLDCAKGVILKVAQEELDRNFQQITHSRLSIMTGLQRRDVLKYASLISQSEGDKSLIAKIIGQWRTQKRYLTKHGAPKVLTLGFNSEFTELVRSVSHDLTPTTVLFELERVGTVVRTEKGVALKMQNYIPKGNVAAGFNILTADSDDLISAVEENLFDNPKLPNLHLRTEYDRVRADAKDELKLRLLKEGQEFHARMRDLISKFDQDVNREPNYMGDFIRVVLGSFSKVSGGNK